MVPDGKSDRADVTVGVRFGILQVELGCRLGLGLIIIGLGLGVFLLLLRATVTGEERHGPKMTSDRAVGALVIVAAVS